MDPSNEYPLPPLFDDEKVLRVSAEVAMGVIGLLLNAFLAFLIAWNAKQNFKKTYLLCVFNLAVTDFFFSFVFIYTSVLKIIKRRVYEDYSECVWEGLLNGIVGVYSLCSIMTLAVDRFCIVVLERPLTVRTILLFLPVNMLVAIVSGVSPLYFHAKMPFVIMPAKSYCLVDLSRNDPALENVVYGLALAYGTALLIINLSYLAIIQVIWRANLMMKTLKEMGRSQIDSSRQTMNERISRSRLNFVSNKPPRKSSLPAWVQYLRRQVQGAAQEFHILPRRISTASASSTPVLATQPKRRRNSELALALRTILMGSTHISLYFPFAVCAIFQMRQFENLDTLDLVSIQCIMCSSVLDPFWNLLFDQNVHKSIDEIINRFSKVHRLKYNSNTLQ